MRRSIKSLYFGFGSQVFNHFWNLRWDELCMTHHDIKSFSDACLRLVPVNKPDLWPESHSRQFQWPRFQFLVPKTWFLLKSWGPVFSTFLKLCTIANNWISTLSHPRSRVLLPRLLLAGISPPAWQSTWMWNAYLSWFLIVTCFSVSVIVCPQLLVSSEMSFYTICHPDKKKYWFSYNTRK